MGVENIITFDAHDPRVQNAIPLKGFETIQPIYQYTKGLLKSIPKMYEADYERLVPIEGSPVDMLNPPKGCPFASRCDSCMKICLREMPPVKNFSDIHYSQCWLNEIEEDTNIEGGAACLKK